MALTRTFLDGDLLTSADINTHLVNQVPNAGDAYDTGWVQLSPAPEIIFVRRVGQTVTVVATGGKNIPSMGRVPVGSSNILPLSLRPAHDMSGTLELRWLNNGVGTLAVDKFGTVWVWNPTTSANSTWYGSITYVV